MEILVAVAVLAGLVWGALLLGRGGLLAGLLMVMLSGICFGLPMFKLELGPIPLTADRVLLTLLVAQYLIWRRWGLVDPRPMGKPEWLLAALVGVLTLSTFSADWSREGYQPVAWLVIYYLMPCVVYVVARQIPIDERSFRVLLVCLAAFAVYLSITTIAEWADCWAIVFPRYIVATAAEDGEWIGRGRGPLLHPIGNGLLLTLCLVAVLCWWPRVGRRGKVLVAAGALLVLVALATTLTRSVWLGGLLALGVMGGLGIPRRWRLPVLGGGLVVSLLLAMVFWENLLSYKRERHLDASMAAESAELRPVLATIAWRMFLDRPLFGCGFGQYGQEHLDYTVDRSSTLPLAKGRGYIAHNVVFSWLTETGAVGLSLFLAVLGLWVFHAWRLWATADAPLFARQLALMFLVAMVGYLVNGMFHDVSVMAMGNMTLFFAAGLCEGQRAWARPWVACLTRQAQPAHSGRINVMTSS